MDNLPNEVVGCINQKRYQYNSTISKYKLIIRYYNNKCTMYVNIYEGKKLTSGLFVLTAIRHGCEIPACFIFLIDMYVPELMFKNSNA